MRTVLWVLISPLSYVLCGAAIALLLLSGGAAAGHNACERVRGKLREAVPRG